MPNRHAKPLKQIIQDIRAQRASTDCGEVPSINLETGTTENHWCILPRWPRHTMHLLGKQEWTPRERRAAVRAFERELKKRHLG